MLLEHKTQLKFFTLDHYHYIPWRAPALALESAFFTYLTPALVHSLVSWLNIGNAPNLQKLSLVLERDIGPKQLYHQTFSKIAASCPKMSEISLGGLHSLTQASSLGLLKLLKFASSNL